MKVSEGLIIIENNYNVSSEVLWQAITEHKEMVHWYFENIPDFKAEVGFHTQFKVISGERTFTHNWTILEVIPNRLIKYSWSYPEYPGDAVVSFEITEKEGGSRLKLINEVLEDFPDEIPEFKRESCIGGWNYFLGDRLKSYLEGQKNN